MNEDFPPLALPQPRIAVRRAEPPRPVPTPPEVIQRRVEIARRLKEQLQPLSDSLRRKSDAERKAIFYKLEHDGPISLNGTDLKPIAEPTDSVTLAIPRDDNLDKFIGQLDKFSTGAVNPLGMIPNAQLAHLNLIAEGDPKDRLSQELFENYETLIAKAWVICEIEMLSVVVGERKQRDEIAAIRQALAQEFGAGTKGVFFEQEEIKGTCRAVIRCTGAVFKSLVESREWQTRISWFEARPEFETFSQVVQNFSVAQLAPLRPPRDDAPLVCVVDTGITSGNPFLMPVTRQDLLKSFLTSAPDNPADLYAHGSGVASLVSYYALNLAPGGVNTSKVWIAGGRILDENNETDRLFSVALKEVVEFFAPLGVKLFNLSVNVRNLRWNRNSKRTVPRGSWTARRIDHLSKQHDVIFIISTGNISPIDVRHFIESGTPYPAYFAHEDASIHDPGQAALALTIGAVSSSTLAVGPSVGRARAMAERGHAAPFTRCGPGLRRAVKPELVDFGGNYLFSEEGGHVSGNQGLNVSMASNKISPAVMFDAGTSFAAPLVSHKLALVLQDLKGMGVDPRSALLKAFIVNSAQYQLTENELVAFRQDLRSEERKAHLNVLGYGIADSERATYCDDYCVVLFFQGAISSNNTLFLNIPVPATLQNTQGVNRLTVTVAHQPDVQRWGLEEYLGTAVKWRMFRGDVSPDAVIDAMSRADDDDTDQEDLPNELKFTNGITIRSRGTVQHDITEWRTHRPEYSENHYTLAIASYERWKRSNPDPVEIAVVVRLEDTSRTAAIYTEVKSAVEVEVRARRTT